VAQPACGFLPYDAAHPPTYQHVVVIMDENVSPSQITATAAPYLTSLKSACGREGFMHAATHFSDPNYAAATSGVTTSAGTMTSNDNVFHQAQVAGDSWKSYEESMPRACATSSPPYNTYHDPAHWYSDLRTPTNTCATHDVPLVPALADDLAEHVLPTYVWIAPNDCHNMHWISRCTEPRARAITTGDAWLGQIVPQILASPSYRAGRTLVVITWDEGSGNATKGVDCTDSKVYTVQASCRIPTYVLSAYVTPGSRDTSDQNLYSLLATTEDALGYPRLGRAVGQPSMRPGLRF
jgi:phosphatidylinositol-3-phosphatase